MNQNTTRLLFSLITFSYLVLAVAGQGLTTSLSAQLCNIVNGIRAVVGILALALFLLGGVMYAVSHFLPGDVEIKKSMTAWSTAMITGGIIGLIIVLLAQPIVSLVNGIGGSAGNGASSLASSAITC